jgi:hypothetical protein
MLADCALMRQIGAMPAPAINVENLTARCPAMVALDVITLPRRTNCRQTARRAGIVKPASSVQNRHINA